MSEILVIGSMNMDLVVETERYPEAGETIIGGKFKQIPGGKGANQAAAAAKLGGSVEFIAACGDDNFAGELKKSLAKSGVKIDNIFEIKNQSTGVAVITVEKNGENRIIVSPGANHDLTPAKIENIAAKIKKAELILIQLEIPLKTVKKIVELAAKYKTKIALDPAPAAELEVEVLNKIDYLLPNEGELELLVKDENLKSREEKINYLLAKGIKNIIVTEGAEGVSFYSQNKNFSIPALKVEAKDTTAAGDVFAGGFAAKLIRDEEIKKVLEFAVSASAYSVTKFGAQSSIPDVKKLAEWKQNFFSKN